MYPKWNSGTILDQRIDTIDILDNKTLVKQSLRYLQIILNVYHKNNDPYYVNELIEDLTLLQITSQ